MPARLCFTKNQEILKPAALTDWTLGYRCLCPVIYSMEMNLDFRREESKRSRLSHSRSQSAIGYLTARTSESNGLMLPKSKWQLQYRLEF